MSKPMVVALGMDAVEGPLVERLVQEGRMPRLAELRRRGLRAEVRSVPKSFVNSWMVWPTFNTGQSLGTHGWYAHKQWSSENQHLYHLDPERLAIHPFWEDIPGGARLALLDVPYSFDPGAGFDGVFLNGWQGPDDLGRSARPSGLSRSLRRRVGRRRMEPEIFGPQTARTLEHQYREGLESLDQFAELAAGVLRQERWDLFLAVLGGAHRACHYLWSLDQADLTGASPEDVKELQGARDSLYEAADRALGRVLDAVPDDAHVLVFALHGMGPNLGWGERFSEIVAHLRARGEEAPSKEGWIYRIKSALPWQLVRQVTRRLPRKLNHALVPLWSRRMLDWSSTSFFALPNDLTGFLRINVRGRDAEGMVEAGPEQEALMRRLEKELMQLRDLRDDSPIVEAVERVDDIVGSDAPRRRDLPDLVVRWTPRSSAGCPGIRSPYGELWFSEEQRIPSGRSGNHTPSAWCVAAGPGIEPGRMERAVDSLELPPTLCHWMGLDPPGRMEGSPVPEWTTRSGTRSVMPE
ncbi:MAG TPA: alkaline phosphatase family protein [Vicinamibacteria bacterium]|nr:alkaline phosphatase family protein [Vicinamibacteria bacterium]